MSRFPRKFFRSRPHKLAWKEASGKSIVERASMPEHQEPPSLKKPTRDRPRLRPIPEIRERADLRAMTKQSSGPLLTLPPVLISESADEFARLRDALKDELKPHGAIEELTVDELADLTWEIRRYRRAKTTLINSAFHRALENLLKRVCPAPGQSAYDIKEDIEDLAYQWFSSQTAKRKVLKELAYFDLDEHAIETEAMNLMAPHLEKLDRLLASREWRLDKTLRSFAEFRGWLGRQLHASVERVIDGEVLSLGNAAKKPPPAAA
jgi:hypothetical protein